MAIRFRYQNLTEGPILKKLIAFAVPMMVGNLLQQVYNLTDTIIVGRAVGREALAAVGASYSLMTFLTSVMIGLCMGCSACMAMSYGADRPEEMREKIWASFWMIGGVTAAIITAVYVFEIPILHILRVPEDTFELMRDYLKIIFGGIVFTFLYNYFAFLLRAVGNSVIPLLYLGSASILNIFLDIRLVLGAGLGVKGAAIATVIAQGFAGVGICLYVWKNGRGLLPEKSERCFRKETLTELAGYSILTCLQQSVMNFGILMIQGLVNTFGTAVMAAFAVCVKIDTIAYMPAQEFGNAYSLYISQNYGAGNKERIRIGTRKAFTAAAVFGVLISLVIWIFAKGLMGIFVDPSEIEILSEGVRYLHIEGAFYIGISALFLFYGLYRGIATPGFSLILTIISLGTRVLLAYLLAPNPSFGVSAIWWAIPIGWFLADLTGFVYYYFRIRNQAFVYDVEKSSFHLNMRRQGIFRTLIEAIGTVYEEAEKKGVVIEMESQHDQQVVHDRAWTARAFVYILKNAVKYCEPGDEVLIRISEEPGALTVEFKDNGMGIPSEDLLHIFEKHYRGRNALHKEGYGMGLYLASRILKKQGGDLRCESAEGIGSIFKVYIKK